VESCVARLAALVEIGAVGVDEAIRLARRAAQEVWSGTRMTVGKDGKPSDSRIVAADSIS
jgi:hypothetical protein